jgi:predicted metal-dependent phosphotriesterase family hydrolase
MKNITLAVLFSFLAAMFAVQPAWSLNSNSIVKLKQAGVSDQTIALIAREKVIETAAFSIDDIVKMKKAGVSDKTLQLMIKDNAISKRPDSIVYGQSTQSIRQLSPQDLVKLKEHGMSDAVIQSVIRDSRSSDEQDRERAWRMLENMDLRIYQPGVR